MVVYTISKHVTNFVGPSFFRFGVKTRNWLAAIASNNSPNFNQNTPYLDLFCGVSSAQKFISLSIYDESNQAVTKYKRQLASPTKVEQALDDTYDALFGAFQKAKPSAKQPSREETDERIAQLRLQVLEDHLRPALLPNEKWSDVLDWKFNPRILKWVRQEFLIAKYGPRVKEAFDAYPQLRSSPQLTRHPTQRMLLDLAKGRPVLSSSSNDSSQTKNNKTGKRRRQYSLLPSTETIMKAFGMRQWATTKDNFRIRQSMVPIAESLGGQVLSLPTASASNADDTEERKLLNHTEIPREADLSQRSLEDILEVAGAQVQHSGPFNTVCEEAGIYQFWTLEFVKHMGDYLWERHITHLQKRQQSQSSADLADSPSSEETWILDVGAGDGLLLHYLQEYMETKANVKKGSPNPMPNMVAADDGSWRIFAKANVERLNVADTLKKYASPSNMPNQLESDNPDHSNTSPQIIVLCSWMPMGQDWTKLFRDHQVDEYILIGEADDGSCGHNWQTWGNQEFLDDHSDVTENAQLRPPFEEDGYRRWDMDVLSQFQFSRFDCKVSRNSSVVSFRREQ